MRVRNLRTCTTPTFAVALAALLANDLYLRTHFPGVITGKLSDFAGLVVVSLVLLPLSPRRKRHRSYRTTTFSGRFERPPTMTSSTAAATKVDRRCASGSNAQQP
jgi:hypothetical protein